MRRAPRRGGLAKGETERQRTPQQPDPERSEGARLKKRTMNDILVLHLVHGTGLDALVLDRDRSEA
jgi:hypothetical protein